MMKIISFITQQGVIRAILAEQAKERATRANIDRGPRSACAPRSGAL